MRKAAVLATKDKSKAEPQAAGREATFADRLKRWYRKNRASTLLSLAGRVASLPGGRRLLSIRVADYLSALLRDMVRLDAGLEPLKPGEETLDTLHAEIAQLRKEPEKYARHFRSVRAKRVLYSGQCYYNAWYLSRALRERDWRADVLNWDPNEASQIYYHGEDFRFYDGKPYDFLRDLKFYVESLYRYDVFHFMNKGGMTFGFRLQALLSKGYMPYGDVELVKLLGKKIAYSNNGCLDGVSQTSFSKWGPESVCSICIWRTHPEVCNDEANLQWGAFRNRIADYQCLLGSNRADANCAPTIHEVPEFYCLDAELWDPGIEIPEKWRLDPLPEGGVRVYHAVGNRDLRTDENGVNIKSSHVYLPLIDKLIAEGIPLDLIHPTGVPNREVRFLQAQADIFLEMLTFGWFGANAREAMMLGKVVVAFVRPEWLEDVRHELPDYAAELPIVEATPETVEAVLRDLIANPEKRAEIGRRSHEFAVKWHSKEAGARRFDDVYSRLLKDDPILLERYA